MLSGRAIEATQRERIERTAYRLELLRLEFTTAISELNEDGRTFLRLDVDPALRVRLTELVESEDHVPNVRAFRDLNHDGGAENLQAAIGDVDAELARIRS